MEQKRILLVEDDSSLRSVLLSCLEMENLLVTEAQNGEEALKEMSSQEFDLVLTDIQMPVMDGITLISKIKEKHPKTPIIVMTGFSDSIETENAKELGTSGFLTKPFSFGDLVEVAKDILLSTETVDNTNFESIQLQDIESTENLPRAVYLMVNDEEFIKLVPEGNVITYEELKKVQEQEGDQVLVEKKNFKEAC